MGEKSQFAAGDTRRATTDRFNNPIESSVIPRLSVEPKKQECVASRSRWISPKGLIPPVGNPVVSSGYGPRKRPRNRATNIHRGADFPGSANPNDKEVVVSAEGIVVYNGPLGAMGNTVVVVHDKFNPKIATMYGHLAAISGEKNGSRVCQGQPIGEIGSTGIATGENVHFADIQNDAYSGKWQYVDPNDYIRYLNKPNLHKSLPPTPFGYDLDSMLADAKRSRPEKGESTVNEAGEDYFAVTAQFFREGFRRAVEFLNSGRPGEKGQETLSESQATINSGIIINDSGNRVVASMGTGITVYLPNEKYVIKF